MTITRDEWIEAESVSIMRTLERCLMREHGIKSLGIEADNLAWSLAAAKFDELSKAPREPSEDELERMRA